MTLLSNRQSGRQMSPTVGVRSRKLFVSRSCVAERSRRKNVSIVWLTVKDSIHSNMFFHPISLTNPLARPLLSRATMTCIFRSSRVL